MQKYDLIEAYFAIINAYFSLNIVFVPKSFKSGGLILTIMFFILLAALTGICTLKIIQCGLVYGTDSY